MGTASLTEAQTQAAATDQAAPVVEEVVVTGSRIAAPNEKSASPIQVVSSQEIKVSGKSDISDLINQLPQNFNNDLGQDLGNRTSGLTTAGGVATADLRGLGPDRTLVLIDGVRLGQGSPYTAIQSPGPDLDQIPTPMVERVEVLTGGASATYGSDAIGGVINFILRKDFQGIEVSGQWGENWHGNHSGYAEQLQRDAGLTPLTGTSRDGRNRDLSIVMGTNFADGRGNVTAYFNYLHTDPVASGDRDFSGCQLDPNATFTGAVCGGSTNSNWFSPRTGPNANTVYSVLGSSFVPFGTPGTNPPAVFNSQPYIYLARQDDRYQAGFVAHEDLNDFVKPYLTFGFMNDRTHQQIAPSALFKDSNPLDPLSGNYNINCSNPLLSAQELTTICTPAQIAAAAANPSAPCPPPPNPLPANYVSPTCANVQIGRRNTEGGGRFSDYEHSNYRALLGFKGGFGDAWTYDVYGQYFYTTFFNSNQKYLSFQAIDNALQVTGTAANPVCISGAPCVPYNIFADNGVTQNALNYLYLSGTGEGSTTLRTAHADITGQLGQYGVRSPAANEGVAVNLGYEHRNENVTFTPDAAELSGLLSGFGGAATAINNSISVDEEFIELRAPLAQDKPLAQDLVFDTGFRRSDYSTSGPVNTYKFELQWAPIRDLRFRGSFQRAIRAPNIIELYNPQVVGLIQVGNDPCAPTHNAQNQLVPATRSLADCLKTGVTAAQYGNGGTTDTIPQGTAGQLSQLAGGNPSLQPEKANTYSVGMSVAPAAVPNFTGSLDYWHIKLEQGVGVLAANIILNDCLDTGNPVYCSQIVRSPNTGGLVGNSLASGGYIIQTNVNVGAAVVSGLDLQAGYRIPFATMGSLNFALNGSYLLKTTTTPYPGAHVYDCAGLFGATCQTVNPRWHHIFRASWVTPWNVTGTLSWRYIGPVRLDNNDPDPSLHFNEDGAYNSFDARIPGFSYLDLFAAWDITKEIELRAGVNNLLDKDPPLATVELVSGGAPNTYSTYDALGRQLFLAVTARF
ncbi:MAG: TonB-dependent receptor [Gammaproteobacteria bacterium]|nr:TonB-dependent receptor [Gammaproteobacteria bacterium]